MRADATGLTRIRFGPTTVTPSNTLQAATQTVTGRAPAFAPAPLARGGRTHFRAPTARLRPGATARLATASRTTRRPASNTGARCRRTPAAARRPDRAAAGGRRGPPPPGATGPAARSPGTGVWLRLRPRLTATPVRAFGRPPLVRSMTPHFGTPPAVKPAWGMVSSGGSALPSETCRTVNPPARSRTRRLPSAEVAAGAPGSPLVPVFG